MNILISEKAYEKVMYWVQKADFEVSGFGLVEMIDENTFFVNDAFLIKQEGTASTTDIDPNSLGKLMYETRDSDGELKWWWHSHVNMSVFWSGTDKNTIETLGSNGWIVASVFNKKKEIRSAVSYVVEAPWGFKKNMFEDEVKTSIHKPYIQDQIDLWDSEFDANVTRKTYSYPNATGLSQFQGWRGAQVGVEAAESQRRSANRSVNIFSRHGSGATGYYSVSKEAEILHQNVDEYLAKLNSSDEEELMLIEGQIYNLEDFRG